MRVRCELAHEKSCANLGEWLIQKDIMWMVGGGVPYINLKNITPGNSEIELAQSDEIELAKGDV